MTPEEAKAYGLIDDIIVPGRGLSAPAQRRPPNPNCR